MNQENYVYRMVQVPPAIAVRAKDERGKEAAGYLESEVNKQATQGWEFYRVDTIGVVTKPGCLSSLFGAKEQYLQYYVITFRQRR